MTDADPPRDDLRRRAFGALASTSLVVVVDRTVQILLISVVARLISPEQTAVAAAVSLLVGVAMLVSSWGMVSALIQIPDLTAAGEATARSILAVLGVVALVTMQFVAPLGGLWFNNAEITAGLRAASLVLLLQPFALVANAHLLRTLRARDAALADMISSLVGTSLVVLLALLGWGFWSLVIGVLVQNIVRTVLLCIFARQGLSFGMDLSAGSALVRKGLGFMTNGLLNRGGHDAPRWLIGRYLPGADLGFFTRASALMAYPATLFSAIAERVVFPAVGLVQMDAQRLRKGVVEAVQLTAIAGLPLTVAMFILGPDIIRLVLGPNWEGAVEPFRILALAVYVRLGDRLTWTILRGMGRTTALSILQIISLGLLIVACAAGAKWGLRGVSVAVVVVLTISYIAASVVSMAAVKVTAREWLVAHRPAVMCSLLAATVLTPVTTALHWASAPSFVVLGVCGVVSAVALGLAMLAAPGLFIGRAGQRLLRTLRQMGWRGLGGGRTSG